MKNDYTYAAARIRVMELSLLGRQDMEQLLLAPGYRETLRLLRDRGWGDGEEYPDPRGMLSREEEKTRELVEELLPEPEVLDPLRYEYDFHNVKAAVKICCTGTEAPAERFFAPGGTVQPERILRCVREQDYRGLPEKLAETAETARSLMLRTGDGQLAEAAADRGFLEALYEAGEKSGEEVLGIYGTAFTAAADIRIALRGGRTGRPLSFFEQALAPIRELDVSLLSRAALEGREKIAEYLEHTDFSGAAEAVRTSDAAFERWADDQIIRQIRPQRSNPFTLGPLAAYVLARKHEIRCVGLILSVKENGLPEDLVRERLGEMYV